MWCTEICVKFNLQSSFHARHSTIQRLHGHRPGIKMMRWKLKKCEQKWYKQFSVVTQYFLYPQNFMKWNWDRQTVRNRGNNQISIPAASAAFSPPSFLRGPGGGSTPLKKKRTKHRTLTSLRGRTSEKKPLWWSKWLVKIYETSMPFGLLGPQKVPTSNFLNCQSITWAFSAIYCMPWVASQIASTGHPGTIKLTARKWPAYVWCNVTMICYKTARKQDHELRSCEMLCMLIHIYIYINYIY